MRKKRPAFTLVELLVVIGIIAVLIGLLMPALSRARQSSRIVSCLSNLRQLSLAANNFATEHKAHYPLAGYANDGTPAGVGDPSMIFYSYFFDKTVTPSQRISPLPEALAPYIGFPSDLSSKATIKNDLINPDGVQKLFTCPDDFNFVNNTGNTAQSGLLSPGYTWAKNDVSSSYIFNGAALGMPEVSTVPRLQGNLAQMHNLANLMFMADGLNRGTKPTGYAKQHTTDNSFEMDNLAPSTVGPISLADAYAFNNADCGCMFDTSRHGRKMNIIFMDGHGDTISLPKVDPYYGTNGGSGQTAQNYIGTNGFNELDRVKLTN